jgi:hypothetical protein
MVRELEARRAVLCQEAVCAKGSIFGRHGNMGPLVALILGMSLDRAYGAVQVQLEDTGMPQRVVNGSPGYARILRNESCVPLRRLAPRYHGNRLPRIKIVLPMREVQHKPQVVPRENARQAGAQLLCVGRLDMCIWPLVDAELQLAGWVAEQRAQRRVNVVEQLGRREALDEDGIAGRDDCVADDGGVRSHEVVEAAVDEAEAEDVVWREILEALEKELRGQLGEVDYGVTLLVARHLLALHTLGALVVEGESSRRVLEGLVVVANMSRHCVAYTCTSRESHVLLCNSLLRQLSPN